MHHFIAILCTQNSLFFLVSSTSMMLFLVSPCFLQPCFCSLYLSVIFFSHLCRLRVKEQYYSSRHFISLLMEPPKGPLIYKCVLQVGRLIAIEEVQILLKLEIFRFQVLCLLMTLCDVFLPVISKNRPRALYIIFLLSILKSHYSVLKISLAYYLSVVSSFHLLHLCMVSWNAV